MYVDAEDYRELFWEQGEPVLWYEAMPCTCYRPKSNDYNRNCPNHCEYGFLYTKRTTAMNGTPLATIDNPDAPNAVIQEKKTTLVNTQTGDIIGLGDGTIMTMPDEIPLVRMDKFVLVARERIGESETKQRGTDDVLNFPFPVSIQKLIGTDGTPLVKGTDFELQDIVNSVYKKINWLSDAVLNGNNYSVKYSYWPQMWFLGMMDRSPRYDRVNAELLPHRGVLTIKHPNYQAGN